MGNLAKFAKKKNELFGMSEKKIANNYYKRETKKKGKSVNLRVRTCVRVLRDDVFFRF